MKMNSDYFVALAKTFEDHYGVEFEGIRKGAGHRSARAPDPVQDQHRRRDVAARSQRAGRLAGGPAGGNRRHRQRRNAAAFRRQEQSLPGRPPARRQSARRTADRDRAKPLVGRAETGGHRALPQGRRSRGHPPLHLGNHQVDELRHRQPLHHAGRGSLRFHQRGARQLVGPLRSGNQSARHAHQGRDSGSRATFLPPSDWSARAPVSIPPSSPACGR